MFSFFSALADLLVAILVMPLSAVYEVRFEMFPKYFQSRYVPFILSEAHHYYISQTTLSRTFQKGVYNTVNTAKPNL